jgi:hypothetical protein
MFGYDMKKICFYLLAALLSPFVQATEPVCPGGSEHRSDIVWCADHENYDHPSCVSGGEYACMGANGYIGGTEYSTFKITKDNPAVGSAALSAISSPGGTGPGYLNMPEQTGSLSASLRFYVKFSDGYAHTTMDRGNHGPALLSNHDGCSSTFALDWYYNGASFLIQSSCSETFLVPNNIKEVQMKNNRWYLVEMQATMNTTTNGSGPFNGNGVLRAFIDGEKVLEYTNVNLRGNHSHILWQGAFTARSYYGLGVPSWSGTISYDNFAYSNTGAYIGPAQNENPRGTADPLSPYLNFTSYTGYTGTKLDDDCSSSSGAFNFSPVEVKWRTAAASSLQSDITHGQYVNYCSPRLKNNPRVLVSSITDGGHAVPDGGTYQARPLEIKGKVFIPRTANFSSPKPIVGFGDTTTASPKDASGYKSYISFGVHNNKWSVIQRTNGGVPVVVNQFQGTIDKELWYDFNLTIDRNSRLGFSINGQNMVSAFTPPQSIGWAWGNGTEKTASSFVATLQDTSSGAVQDKALQVRLTKSKDGGGVEFYKTPSKFSNAYVIHGWMYLPSSNDYSKPVALSGFSRYGTDSLDPENFSNWGKYIAVSVSDGKWSLIQKDGGNPFVGKKTSVPVVFDQWHEFEIFIQKGGTASLMINKEWIIEDHSPSGSISWAWNDSSGGIRSLVIGVLDFHGQAPFTAYFDDTSVLSASAWSCKGWSEASCPFN